MLLVNAAIYNLAPPQGYIQPDTASYVSPARVLLDTGVFSSDSRGPGYPLFITAAMAVTDHFGPLIVFCQVLLLFFSGVVAGRIAAEIHPKAALPAILMVCFN